MTAKTNLIYITEKDFLRFVRIAFVANKGTSTLCAVSFGPCCLSINMLQRDDQVVLVVTVGYVTDEPPTELLDMLRGIENVIPGFATAALA